MREAAGAGAPNAFIAGSPSRHLLGLIADKWVFLTLAALAGGPKRYTQLAHRLSGVSPKMLTQTLRKLEAAGLIDREVVISVPVQVTYSLTGLGESLTQIAEDLKYWSESSAEQVGQHQAEYAKRTS